MEPLRPDPRSRAERLHLHPLLESARAVLFDVGGTLLHPDWARLISLAEAETGHRFGAEELQRGFCREVHEADRHLAEGREAPDYTRRHGWVFHRVYTSFGLADEDCQRLLQRAEELHAERHLWSRLDPQAPAVLGALKKSGRRVAAISNTEDGRLDELLRLVEIAHLFDLFLDSHVVGLRKPEAAIFHLALDQLGVAPAEAVYVGDSYGHDVLGAARAGMRAILIDPHDLYRGGDFPRIRTLAELVG